MEAENQIGEATVTCMGAHCFCLFTEYQIVAIKLLFCVRNVYWSIVKSNLKKALSHQIVFNIHLNGFVDTQYELPHFCTTTWSVNHVSYNLVNIFFYQETNNNKRERDE